MRSHVDLNLVHVEIWSFFKHILCPDCLSRQAMRTARFPTSNDACRQI